MSNEQATPRTDANLRGWQDELPAPFVEFTRQLERELANKTAECERLREAALAAVQSCECTLRERDSGHRVGCFAPELAEALAATRQESSNG
jgi:uncharacterized protein YeaO (DUF488 family)